MRLDHRRAVPGQQPPRHQPRRRREGLRPVVGGEDVGLVRQQYDVRAGAVDLARGDGRVAPVPAAGQHVGQPGPGEQVVGVGRRADDHPGVAPDRDGDRRAGARRASDHSERAATSHGGSGRPSASANSRDIEARAWSTVSIRVTHTGDAGLAEAAYVELAVLLHVGDHEVGGEGADRRQVGVLGAADARHVEVGRVGAPVGGADQDRRARTSRAPRSATAPARRRGAPGPVSGTSAPRSSRMHASRSDVAPGGLPWDGRLGARRGGVGPMSTHVGPVGLPIDGRERATREGWTYPGPQPRDGRAALGASPTPGSRTRRTRSRPRGAPSTRRAGAPTARCASRPCSASRRRWSPSPTGWSSCSPPRPACPVALRAAYVDDARGRAARPGPAAPRRRSPPSSPRRRRRSRWRSTRCGARLVAGGAVVLKPAPEAARAAIEIGRIALDFLPRGVLNVVATRDVDVAIALTARPPGRRGGLHRLRGRRRAGAGRGDPGPQARPRRHRAAAERPGQGRRRPRGGRRARRRRGRHQRRPGAAGSRPAWSCRRSATWTPAMAAIEAMDAVVVGRPARSRHRVRAAALRGRARPGAALRRAGAVRGRPTSPCGGQALDRAGLVGGPDRHRRRGARLPAGDARSSSARCSWSSRTPAGRGPVIGTCMMPSSSNSGPVTSKP